MRLLLDTHALLWWLFDDPKLTSTVRDLVGDPANEIRVSTASAWEISTKYRLGKLPAAQQLIQDMGGWFQKAGFLMLPIQLSHAERAGSWPQAHRDPFDRMLAAQSVLEELPLLTRDRKFHSFGIRTIW